MLQVNNYYPFGMLMAPYGETYSNKYRYNGKENLTATNSSYGVDVSWYDYGARFYDPQIGRWHSVDPMAELDRRWSPYRYAYDNPLRFIDPDGMVDWDAIIRGTATAIGGLGSTIAGVGFVCTPTGVGQVAGTFLISTGVPATGLGIAMIISGIIDDGSSEKIPGGVLESVGIAGDAFAGNTNGELRKAGDVADIVTNLAVGGLPKTLIEQAALGVDVVTTASDIVDVKGGKESQATSTTATENNSTTAVKDNTNIKTNVRVADIDVSKVQVDQEFIDDFFSK
ncbi:MAG: RHS repeat-associated core domain-containing protein [Ignavibacteriaceae bacterium]